MKDAHYRRDNFHYLLFVYSVILHPRAYVHIKYFVYLLIQADDLVPLLV